MSSIDIETVRGDTPGCNEIVHLNNAGAALPPQPVLTTMIDYLETEARLGSYETAIARVDALDLFYDAGSRLLGCRADELAFVPSATQAWQTAFASVPLNSGDRVLVTSAEYTSNVFALIQARNRGVVVDLIPDDADGRASVEALEGMLDDKVKLVCATHVPTGGGIVNPVVEIGKLVATTPARYLVDAAQSLGQMPVRVDDLRCDYLIGTGRKFLRGPRGTGLLYVRSSAGPLLDPPLLDGRSATWTEAWRYELASGARRFETFEVSLAAKAAFGVAIEYALKVGIEAIEQRVTEVADSLRAKLEAIPFVHVLEGGGPHSGIVPFYHEGRRSDAVVASLRAWGVNTSLIEPLPGQFDSLGRNTQHLIRASVHYYNTDAELDDAVAAL
ncbi:MAG: aminotransferase class V-fold PLP-dependent enzyme [Actinomycetota bacterium]